MQTNVFKIIDLNRLDGAEAGTCPENTENLNSLLVQIVACRFSIAHELDDPYPSIEAYLEFKLKYKDINTSSMDNLFLTLLRVLKGHQFKNFDFRSFSIKSLKISPSIFMDSAITIAQTLKNNRRLKNKIVDFKDEKETCLQLFSLIAKSCWQLDEGANKQAIESLKTSYSKGKRFRVRN